MANQVNRSILRTLAFAAIAAVFYVAGYANGALLLIVLGGVAEGFFWVSLFKRAKH